MPTKNPRVNVVLDVQLYDAVCELSQGYGVSMSMAIRDLVREAVEIREDVALAQMADKRDFSFDQDKALSHEEVWD